MPRFVILEHDHPVLHWDLMLERDGVLRTWRLVTTPLQDRSVAAELIHDHRLHYLDYEGPISGGRGQVQRWDHGTYQTEEENAEHATFQFHGARLSGRASLERHGDGSWSFRWQLSGGEEREVNGGGGDPEKEGQHDGPQEP